MYIMPSMHNNNKLLLHAIPGNGSGRQAGQAQQQALGRLTSL